MLTKQFKNALIKRKIMQKEVDKLNIGKKDRYKIHQPMINVLWIIKKFNPLKY